MEERISKLEEEIQNLKRRNERVEAEKGWETSLFRKISVVVITYVIATIALQFIGVVHSFQNALIPTIGYILSTQSLPLLKKWWIRKFVK